MLESFATPFIESPSPHRGFLRGEKVAKPDEGANTGISAIDQTGK
jgi:hypothetical protein